jgi:hypothetical protein
MLRTMIIKQMLIGLAVISTPFMIASCSDDGGSNDPDVEEGTVDAQASGSENLDLSGGTATFQDSTGTSQFFNGQEVATTQVVWTGSNGNSMSFNLTKLKSSSIGTGTFEPADLSTLADPDVNRFLGDVTATIDSTEYTDEGGAIKVTTKNSSKVIGKFQDLKLETFVGSDSVILNGAFHATK